ncbi:MATE family efflux transporter [Bermanella sp. WJH001]|uniref:MATE family efflux transporter n=1 Tax=Bermanella sp. WJH001 TaxID=3048005 RepID=UPI0024BDC4F0|nr:MATE family efflux transporter [Bermanella sp. WJH001]MDJ1538897.1 MATE family efflux transporter [Bermanella sp. WJH001]
MLSNVSVPLLGLVDTAILGHLGDSRYLAAVAMGTSLFTFVFWSFAFLRMGTTAMVAKHYQQPLPLNGVLQSAVILAVAIGMGLILLAQPLISLMLNLVDAVADITPLSERYLSIRFYFAPVTLLNYVALGYLIGLGRTQATLVILVCTNILNGVLNYIFVYSFQLNSEGVAYASNIAESTQLLLALYFIKPQLFNTHSFAFAKSFFSGFLKLNIQLFIRTFFLLFAFAFFMSKGAQHSTALLSANAILINLLMFISNALDGFAIASESLVGKALADKNIMRIKRVISASGIWSFMFALGFSFALWIANGPIVNLLTSQEDVLGILDQLHYWLIFLPLAGFACYWLDGIFIGLAAGKAMRDSVLFALFVLFLPLQHFLDQWPIHGLWLALFAFLIGRAIWQLAVLPKIMQYNANNLTK